MVFPRIGDSSPRGSGIGESHIVGEPDPEHRFLLHALNRGSERTPRRSIGTGQVFSLCRTLFDDFSETDLKAALALVNRRNDELHSGAAAFDEYPPKYWLTLVLDRMRVVSEE